MSEEKLAALLAEQHESEHLDYKLTLDLDQQSVVVELAKDVGAMQVEGGYLVIGADERGVPGGISESQARLLDEATLRAKLVKYLPEPLDLRSAVHSVEDRLVGLIYVGAHPLGCAVFKIQGSYRAGGKMKHVFSAGEFRVRRGTASVRPEQEDLRRIIERVVERRREDWRREVRDILLEASTAQAQSLARGPASNLTWRLDEEAFRSVLIELLRANDDIPLRLFLDAAPGEARPLLRSDAGELMVLLDRLACAATTFLSLGRPDWLTSTVQALLRIYDFGFERGTREEGVAVGPQELWIATVLRVYAIGAAALRRAEWESLRALVLQRGSGDDYYVSWLRHADVMAARAGVLDDQEEAKLGLLNLARAEARRRSPCLSGPEGASDDEDPLLNELCQFNMLAGLVVISAGARANQMFFHFGRFWSHRTEPIVARLLEDERMRRVIFPGSDQELADALRVISTEAFRSHLGVSGWDGFDDARVTRFLQEHPPAPA